MDKIGFLYKESDFLLYDSRMIRSEQDDGGLPQVHSVDHLPSAAEDEHKQEQQFRKALNREFREVTAQSVPRGVKLIVHRPDPPLDTPSLVVGIRVDESASMTAQGRLEAAKRTVVAVYEFCRMCGIPVHIYGDTANVSKQEHMSVYVYADDRQPRQRDKYRLMGIRARSNNRDGLALRLLADRLAASPQQSKLLISISDGQPKAMDDYTGSKAIADMKQTISEYERKGVTIVAAAIGQDKDVICDIYGKHKFLDITNLAQFPAVLVGLIARYI